MNLQVAFEELAAVVATAEWDFPPRVLHAEITIPSSSLLWNARSTSSELDGKGNERPDGLAYLLPAGSLPLSAIRSSSRPASTDKRRPVSLLGAGSRRRNGLVGGTGRRRPALFDQEVCA